MCVIVAMEVSSVEAFFIFPWFAVLVLVAFVLILAAVAVVVVVLLAAPVAFVLVLVLAAVAVSVVVVVVVVVVVSFRVLCRPYFGVRIYSRSFLHFPSLPSSKALILLFLFSLSHSLFAQNPFISLLTPIPNWPLSISCFSSPCPVHLLSFCFTPNILFFRLFVSFSYSLLSCSLFSSACV